MDLKVMADQANSAVSKYRWLIGAGVAIVAVLGKLLHRKRG